MSGLATGWALEQDLDTGAKLVLVVLADSANRDNGFTCWYGQATLAKRSGLARSTVQRKLELLRAAGLITIEERRRDDGGWTSNRYRLTFADATPRPAAGHPPPAQERHPLPDGEATPASPDEARSVKGTVKRTVKRAESVGFAADAARLADLLEVKVNEIAETPGRKRVSERWITAIERLMRIDGRTAEQVHFVITWLGGPTEGGQFWGANVQSGPKLRAKFDQLVARIKLERRNGNGRSVGRSGEDLRAMASKLREAGN